jgi:acyl-CoA synthetase (AMP-forming)/AMP-acid ligase II
MLEAHYSVLMIGAVLNPINIRLDPAAIAFCLDHGGAKLFLADREFHSTIAPALELMGPKCPIVIDIADAETAASPSFGGVEYESFIASGSDGFVYSGPQDEWDACCLLYTSGTTGNPKGVVFSHRGAYLGALANALTFKLDHDSRYLWTLPMFHCYFTIMSGSDQACLPALTMGASGAIGTTYNIMAAHFVQLYTAYERGDIETARELQYAANRVIKALTSVPTIAALKVVLARMGFDCGVPRRPMRPLTAEEETRLWTALQATAFEEIAGITLQTEA